MGLKTLRFGFWVWVLFKSFVCFGSVESTSFSAAELELLIDHLDQGEFKQDFYELFSGVAKVPDMVKVNVTEPIVLSHERYKHYTYKSSLKRARAFQRKWRTALGTAERLYQVDKSVIVAILLVETNFGRYMGRHHLISVFPSVFVDSHALLSKAQLAQDVVLERRLRKKKKWALAQLKALLEMSRDYSWDLKDLKGSYAGAIGLCQFLPSSYLDFAKSAKPGQRPDLFRYPDAILSIANYLKGHGYSKQASLKEKRKAVYAYNNSQVYVDVILDVAKRLSL